MLKFEFDEDHDSRRFVKAKSEIYLGQVLKAVWRYFIKPRATDDAHIQKDKMIHPQPIPMF